MGQRIKPGTTGVANGGTGTEYMTISPNAEKALSVWSAIVEDRANAHDPTHNSRVHYDRISAKLTETAGSVYGYLLAIAVEDAQTRAELPTDLGEMLRASWGMATRLRDEEHRINPPRPIRIEQPNTCRHRVRYTDECADCDTDFT